MKNILVSIVVPIYNVDKYLDRCLNSIKMQDYKNIEVIMVNDGSKDLSRNIALKFQNIDDRFTLYDKENGGLSSARNYGMKHINGEFVVFIDSDDFVAENYISTLLNEFDDKTDIVIGEYAIFDATTEKMYYHSNMLTNKTFCSKEEKTSLLRYLINGPYAVRSVWKNMYRCSFLYNNKIEFVSERIIYAEDFLFHLEAYHKARKIKTIQNIVFYHLVISGSLSQGFRSNFFEMQVELYNSIHELLMKYDEKKLAYEYEQQIPSIIGSCIFNLSKCKYDQAIKNVKKVLKSKYAKNAYKRAFRKSGLYRYRILYKFGKTKMASLCVFVVKLMLICNPIYRRFQRKQEYIPSK